MISMPFSVYIGLMASITFALSTCSQYSSLTLALPDLLWGVGGLLPRIAEKKSVVLCDKIVDNVVEWYYSKRCKEIVRKRTVYKRIVFFIVTFVDYVEKERKNEVLYL